MSWFNKKETERRNTIGKKFAGIFKKKDADKGDGRIDSPKDLETEIVMKCAQIPINVHKRALEELPKIPPKFYKEEAIVECIFEFLVDDIKILCNYAHLHSTFKKVCYSDKFWKAFREELEKNSEITEENGFKKDASEREIYLSILKKMKEKKKAEKKKNEEEEASDDEIDFATIGKVEHQPSPDEIPNDAPNKETKNEEKKVEPKKEEKKKSFSRREKKLEPVEIEPYYIVDWRTITYKEEPDDHCVWFTNPDTNEKEVEASTLDKLIEILTSHTYFDLHFLHTFMITFRSFTDRETLLKKLMERFNLPPPPDCTPEKFAHFKKEKLDKVRLRITQTIKNWMESFFKFDFDEGMVKEIENVIDVMERSNAKHLAKMIRDTLKKMTEEDLSSIKVAQLKCPPIQKPKASLFGNKKKKMASILNWPNIEIARQITLIDFEVFKKIEPKECLNQSWNKGNREQRAPNIFKMIQWFNRLSNWVGTCIVETVDLQDRIKVMTQFIEIACELKNLNNFNSVFSICSGLSLAAVYRLKQTWNGLDDKTKAKYQELHSLISRDKNFRNIRQAIKSVNPPCIPYIGLYLTDLTFIEDGNPKYIEKNNLKMINFVKCKGFANVIRDMQTYQNTRYALQEAPELKELLLNITHLPEKEMYKLSLEREARVKKRRPVEKKVEAKTELE